MRWKRNKSGLIVPSRRAIVLGAAASLAAPAVLRGGYMPLLGAGGAGAAAASYNFLNVVATDTGSATVTCPVTLGAAGAGRAYVVCCVGQNKAPTAGTFDGNSMTLVDSQEASGWPSGIYTYEDTTTTGSINILVTFSTDTFSYRVVSVWEVRNLASITPTHYEVQLDITTDVVSVTAGEFLFGAKRDNISAAWSGSTEEPDATHTDTTTPDPFGSMISADWVIDSTTASFDINMTGDSGCYAAFA